MKNNPEKRIKRISRWIAKCGEMSPTAIYLYPYSNDPYRQELADELFAVELSWLCDFALRKIINNFPKD